MHDQARRPVKSVELAWVLSKHNSLSRMNYKVAPIPRARSHMGKTDQKEMHPQDVRTAGVDINCFPSILAVIVTLECTTGAAAPCRYSPCRPLRADLGAKD